MARALERPRQRRFGLGDPDRRERAAGRVRRLERGAGVRALGRTAPDERTRVPARGARGLDAQLPVGQRVGGRQVRGDEPRRKTHGHVPRRQLPGRRQPAGRLRPRRKRLGVDLEPLRAVPGVPAAHLRRRLRVGAEEAQRARRLERRAARRRRRFVPERAHHGARGDAARSRPRTGRRRARVPLCGEPAPGLRRRRGAARDRAGAQCAAAGRARHARLRLRRGRLRGRMVDGGCGGRSPAGGLRDRRQLPLRAVRAGADHPGLRSGRARQARRRRGSRRDRIPVDERRRRRRSLSSKPCTSTPASTSSSSPTRAASR